MIKNFLSLIMLGVFCSACGAKSGNSYGAIDQTKLHNDKEKYGIVISRAMVFDNNNQRHRFFHDSATAALTNSNDVDIFAKEISGKEDGFFYVGYHVGGNWSHTDEAKEKEKIFTITPRVAEFLDSREATFKPEYFYTLKMLPEGEYYISGISLPCHYHGSCFKKDFNKKESPCHFTVKSGYINYIGDFYFSSPKKDGGFFSNTYTLGTSVLNRSNQAKEFLIKYHPELNLPFLTNLVKKAQN